MVEAARTVGVIVADGPIFLDAVLSIPGVAFWAVALWRSPNWQVYAALAS